MYMWFIFNSSTKTDSNAFQTVYSVNDILLKKLIDEILFNFNSKHKLRKLKSKQANKKPNTHTHTSLDHLQIKMTLQNS